MRAKFFGVVVLALLAASVAEAWRRPAIFRRSCASGCGPAHSYESLSGTICPGGVCPVPPSAGKVIGDTSKPIAVEKKADATPALADPFAESPEAGEVQNAEDAWKTAGVEWDKIEPHKVTFNGRPISCEQAMSRIEKQVPKDGNNLRVTAIGSATETSRFKTWWAGTAQELRDACTLWTCGPDHWSLKDLSTDKTVFHTAGHPTWYIQRPDGFVLHRSDSFEEQTATEAVRKAVKGYDHEKDVDLSKKKTDPAKKPKVDPESPMASPSAITLWILAAIAAIIIFAKRNQQ